MRKLLLRTVVVCEECERRGVTKAGRIADHIIPKAQGGGDERSNYQLLCDDCSEAKTIAEKALSDAPGRGVDRSGRPTSANHPWNRA